MDTVRPGRKKRLLAPSEKYEIWLHLGRGETTAGQAADRAGVDRSTVSKPRDAARQGALDALAALRPGRRGEQRDTLAKVPDETVLFPGHLYSFQPSATMGQTRRMNYVFTPSSEAQWLMMCGQS